MHTFFEIFKQTLAQWIEDKAPRLAAALAFYTIFSLAPLLVVAVAVAGAVFGEDAARGAISAQFEDLAGASGATLIETALKNASQTGAITIAGIISLLVLLFGATAVFAQLQDALNTIWDVQPEPGRPIQTVIQQRFTAFTMVLGIGFLLLVSLVISAILNVLQQYASEVLPGLEFLWQFANIGISFVITTLLFAMIFKILPDVHIVWGDVWIGAIVTAVLFTIGKSLIGIYLGQSGIGSIYGAAGSLAVILIWVYYSGLILFLGAEFTQVYSRRYGTHIKPAAWAIPLTAQVRAQQGIPRFAQKQQAARDQACATEEPAPPPDPPSIPERRATVIGFLAGLFVGIKRRSKKR
jgi:membrane protein